MINIFKLYLNDHREIDVNIENEEVKDENLYYFSRCLIYFINEENKILIYDDFLTEALTSLVNSLTLVRDNKQVISEKNYMKGAAYNFNLALNIEQDFELDDVWSTIQEDNQSLWIYNYKNETYLEIGKIYHYHFLELPENEMTYEDFMRDYKFTVRILLTKEMIDSWLKLTEPLLKKLKK
ncbi:hypothetical protein ACFO26_04655 [Lactococcus nasutitermitis]|uniref:Uncharacterized protein n=1 Tax=Lactococcus nasutitermitis TaxID=1652957 RepID=A0ABV9JCP1_9LACT|nr:hypothetical protein [Lactococcus nasutitermitis]